MGNQASLSSLSPATREIVAQCTRTHGTTLDLSHQGLANLPDRLHLKHVLCLSLSHNQLSHLPDLFRKKWRRLQSLDLSFNHFSSTPQQLQGLCDLITLDLKGNRLCVFDLSCLIEALSTTTTTPSQTQTQTQPRMLHNINLFNNRITQLPADIWTILIHLEQLVADFNLLEQINLPASFDGVSLPHLRTLRLARNLLTRFDLPLFAIAPGITLVDVSNNQLDRFCFSPSFEGADSVAVDPANMSGLLTLESLNLSHNRLVSSPSFPPQLTRLAMLDMSENGLSSLPDSISHLIELKELFVSHNRISQIPLAFSALVSLELFDGSNNQIQSLPQEISNLTTLSKLILSRNELSVLPTSLYHLPMLRSLNLSFNSLAAFLEQTDVQSPLHAVLDELYLSFNKLDSFPDSILQFTKIHTLGLAYNRISALPQDFPRLVELKYLFLSGNQIWNISFELRDLTSLKWLYINNNSMRSVPHNLNEYNCEVKDISGNDVLSMNAGNMTPKEESNTGRRRSNCFRGAAVKQSKRFRVSHADMIGRRPFMEDATCLRGSFRNRQNEDLFAVFDGHGVEGNGKKAADYLTMYLAEDLENALSEAFKPFAVKSAIPAHLAPAKPNSYREGFRPPVESLTEEDQSLNPVVARSSAAEPREIRGLSGRRNLNVGHLALGENGAPVLQEDDDLNIEKAKEIEVVTKVIESTFEKTNDTLLEQTKKHGDTLGATAAVAYIRKNRIYAANCGDSRILICRNKAAIQLSIDHKPFLREEEERVRQAGGFVSESGRMNGQIAVTRSFGDSRQRPMMIATPFIHVFEFDPSTDPFLVLACDGVFDVLTNQQVIDCVLDEFEHDPSLAGAASRVRDAAYQMGSTDNISVMVVGLA